MARKTPFTELEEKLRGIGLGSFSRQDPAGCEVLLANAVRQTMFEHCMEGFFAGGRRRKASVQLLGSPIGVRALHRSEYSKFKQCQQSVGGCINLTYGSTYSNPIYPSKNAFGRLQRVSVLDLYLDEAATGHYLLLRTIEPSYNQISITTIVEDHVGNVTLFSAYNYARPDVDANDLFPPGTVFILKEPYFKIPKIGRCMLRTDCPTDIIILRPSHSLFGLTEGVTWKNSVHFAGVVDPVMALPVPLTGQDWKKRGDELLAAGRGHLAVECYRFALRVTDVNTNPRQTRILQLCLSTAYIRQTQYEAGLKCAVVVLDQKPDWAKGLFRAGRACYELRRYREAADFFDRILALDSENSQAKAEVVLCKQRLLEESGQFDMHCLYFGVVSSPCTRIDCADYVGPVKVVKSPAGHRTVVATKDIEPGTLLVVSKALCVAWEDLLNRCIQFNTNFTIDSDDTRRLTSELAEVVWRNPKTFGSLAYGMVELPGDPMSPFCDPATEEEPIVDVATLHTAAKVNTVSLYLNKKTWQQLHRTKIGSGLFAFPSFFRHSCLPSAAGCNYNDVLVIRAIRLIQSGQEVFVNKLPPGAPFRERSALCSARGFQCHCILCELDRSEPESCHRVREEVLALLVEPTTKVPGLQRYVVEVEDSYSNSQRTQWKLDLFPLYYRLGLAYCARSNHSEAIVAFLKALNCFGFTRKKLTLLGKGKTGLEMLDTAYLNRPVLDVLACLVNSCHRSDRQFQAQMWRTVLEALEKVLTGEDLDCIRHKYEFLRDVV